MVARGHAAQAPHRGERAQLQETEDARRLHVHADVQLVGESLARRPAGQPLREPRRQHRGDFLDAGLQVLDDVHRLVRLRLHFLPHALEARLAGFQVGDPDHVLVAHPQREEPAGLVRQLEAVGAAAAVAVELRDRLEPVEVERCVRRVLEVGRPRDAFLEDPVRIAGKCGADALDRVGAPGLQVGRGGRARLARRVRVAEREALEAALDALARVPDRGLALGARQRQHARAGHRAEHHRADHGAGARRQVGHVEEHRALRELAGGLDDAVGVGASVAHRHLLGDGVDAVGRGDERRALGADEPVLHRAAGLEQLGGDHEVDVAGGGREREHRAPRAERVPLRRIELDVVSRRAGALRDAGDRGALHRVAGRGRRGDEPVGEHAAAFAAERGYQDRDRPGGELSALVSDRVGHRVHGRFQFRPVRARR